MVYLIEGFAEVQHDHISVVAFTAVFHDLFVLVQKLGDGRSAPPTSMLPAVKSAKVFKVIDQMGLDTFFC